MSTTAATFTPGQDVLAVVDPRRAARPATFISLAELDGSKVVVSYKVKGGDERLVTIPADRIAPMDEQPADDVPTVDVNADVQADGARYSDTDEELIAAMRRSVELGEATEITPEWLVQREAELAAAEDDELANEVAEHVDVEAGLDAVIAENEAERAAWDEGPLRPEVTEHTADVREAAAEAKAEPKPGKKAALPEGTVTPVGLAKILNERGLYTGTSAKGLTSQQVYSYIKAAEGTDHAFPGYDHDGRTVVDVEKGVAWWAAKNERAAKRGQGTGGKATMIARHEVGQRLADILAELSGDEQANALDALAGELLA